MKQTETPNPVSLAGPPGLQGFRGEAGLPGPKGKTQIPHSATLRSHGASNIYCVSITAQNSTPD